MPNRITMLSRNPLLGTGLPGRPLAAENSDPAENLLRYVYPQDRSNFSLWHQQVGQLSTSQRSAPVPPPKPAKPVSELPDYIGMIRKQMQAGVIPPAPKKLFKTM